MTPTVEITTSGRGGQIIYREGDNAIIFDWEFAMSPVLALVWGPSRAGWDQAYPWATDRQAAVYNFVGAEILRQKAPDRAFEHDLDRGELVVLDSSASRLKRSSR
jgi:hypothetical protein